MYKITLLQYLLEVTVIPSQATFKMPLGRCLNVNIKAWCASSYLDDTIKSNMIGKIHSYLMTFTRKLSRRHEFDISMESLNLAFECNLKYIERLKTLAWGLYILNSTNRLVSNIWYSKPSKNQNINMCVQNYLTCSMILRWWAICKNVDRMENFIYGPLMYWNKTFLLECIISKISEIFVV